MSSIFTKTNGQELLFINIVSKNQMYKSLSKKLLENITMDQLNAISVKKNVILYRDLIKCYDYEGEEMNEEITEGINDVVLNECLCGKKDIQATHFIRNTDTKQRFIVGSVCCRNWYNPKSEDKCTYLCKYCNRSKNTGFDCIDCIGKRCCKSFLNRWKSFVKISNEKLTYGKYKGLISIHDLVTKRKYKSYMEYILSNECIYVKTIEKEKILLCK